MTTIKKISKDGIVYELPRPIEIDISEFRIKSDADVILMLISEWKKDRDNYLVLKTMINNCYELLLLQKEEIANGKGSSLPNTITNELELKNIEMKWVKAFKRWIDEKR